MLGAIIGDIVGSRWEFSPTNDYNFELFSDKNSFTDDTICTVAVADALLHDSDDFGAYIHKWCRKYPHPMGGYGGRFAKWVMSDNPQPYGSYGNGSAMRVSPIGWWYVNDLWEKAAKSAACTHNHEEGIRGAQAVVWAMADAKELRATYGDKLTEEIVLNNGLDHGVGIYEEFPQNFNVDLNKCRNKFDETCQGTVPVALWIVLHSKSFEDAIRQAVSLGADADTLGAIVGSIAEPLWGIPEWMKEKALSYLPEDIKSVVEEFHKRTSRLRKLSKQCQYYVFDDFIYVSDDNKEACEIEREWVHYIAKSYANADLIKAEMAKRFPMEQWQDVADNYDLPVSLLGTISNHILTPKHKSLKKIITFLEKHYSMRKANAALKKAEKEKKQHIMAIMHWKLGLGNFNKLLSGESPLPDKSKKATKNDWNIEPMPTTSDEMTEMPFDFRIPASVMEIIKNGHIPEVQEDHWFMYCDDEYIRYYRSWTGMCAFEAHYNKVGTDYRVNHLKMNHALAEFGVNGDRAGAALFCYLLIAEAGGDSEAAWQNYLNAWEELNEKYSKKD